MDSRSVVFGWLVKPGRKQHRNSVCLDSFGPLGLSKKIVRSPWSRMLLLVLSFVSVPSLLAQNRSAEFIESTSPLPGGGRVISRSAPDASVQTVTTGEATVNGHTPAVPNRNANLVPGSSYQSGPQSPVVSGGVYQPYPATNPYPTSYASSIAQPRSVVLHPPIRATAPQTNSIPYQIPTLGITNTITNRENKSFTACPCNAQSALRPPVTSSAAIPVQTPPTSPPAGVAQCPDPCSPSFVGAQRRSWFGPANDPQLAIQPNGCYYPPVEATGAYQPVFRMANLPPGVYVGEGMFGKPQTYRDGQPVRNLFRFVIP